MKTTANNNETKKMTLDEEMAMWKARANDEFGKTLKEIEKAILASDIGITPNSDGKVIRLTFPQPTEERRKELVKDVKKYGEDAKVAIRNVRRDALDKFKKQEKAHEITEDDLKGIETDIQKLTDKYISEIEKMVSEKEKEVMAV